MLESHITPISPFERHSLWVDWKGAIIILFPINAFNFESGPSRRLPLNATYTTASLGLRAYDIARDFIRQKYV